MIAEGELFVTDLGGPFSDKERDQLLSFRRAEHAFGPRWTQSQASLFDGPDGVRALFYSVVWLGNVSPPGTDYGSLCRVIVSDRQGNVIHEGRPLPAEVRRGEYTRVYSPLTELESDERVGEIEVACDEPGANLPDRMHDEMN